MGTIEHRSIRPGTTAGLDRRGIRTLTGLVVAVLMCATSALAVTSPTISVTDVTVTEDSGRDIDATFVVTLSEAAGEKVTVGYRTADGSAVAPDYRPASGTLSFAPGELSKTVTVEVDGDTVAEGDEVFYLELLDAGNAVVSDPQGVATIVDDDRTIEIDDAFVAEPGPGGEAFASFQVSLSSPSPRRVAVDFSTEDGSAIAGEDYGPVTGTLVFKPGEASKTILIPVRNDRATGPDQYFYVILFAPSNADLVRAKGQATIVETDRVVAVGDTVLLEPDPGTEGLAVFEVSLSVPTSGSPGTITGSPSSEPITVDFTTADGTAIAGQNYEPVSGTLTFAPGEGTRTFAVAVRNDGIAGQDKTFFIYLSNPTNAKLSDAIGEMEIVDSARTLAVEDTTVSEGDAPGVAARFVLSLSSPAPHPITVRYATRDGVATAGSDYQPTGGLVTFDTGETTKNVDVPVVSDTVDEGEAPQIFYLDLSNPVGVQVVRSTAIGSIVDDDLRISVADVTVAEGDAGTTDVVFTVSISSYAGRAVQVDYTTADGTATAPSDYTPRSGTLTIPVGEVAATIAVPVAGDLVEEPAETFFLRLSNPVGAKLPLAQGVATISVSDRGYWLVASDGGVFSFGDAPFYGSAGDEGLEEPVVSLAVTPSGNGYWLAAADGSVFAYGDARLFGDGADAELSEPVVVVAATPSGSGYWLAAADGRVLPFGDARFYGSLEDLPLNNPVVALAATPSGNGYWAVTTDGGVFAFGDAGFFGSTGAIRLNQPIVGMAVTPRGNGYWLTAADGGIFAFGDAGFFGSTGAMQLNQPVVGMAGTSTGLGYWLVATDGGVFTFGDADFLGSAGGTRLNRPVVGMGPRTGRTRESFPR